MMQLCHPHQVQLSFDLAQVKQVMYLDKLARASS